MLCSCRSLALVGLCLLPVLNSHAADLYRWQDDQGKVHYTDRVPPEYVKHGYRVISEQGITIQTIKSVDELKANMPPAAPEVPPEQLKNDRRLLMTYGSEHEIVAARKRKVSDLESLIELSRETLSLLDVRFRELAKKAGDYEKQNKPIPESLLTQIAATRKKVDKYQTRLEQHQAKLEATTEQFDQDLKRYRELKRQTEQAE